MQSKLKKENFKDNSVNRDTNKGNPISPKSFDLCPPDMLDKPNEPEPKISRRFASAVVLKKIRAIKYT